MRNADLNMILSSIHSFEDYEKFKLKIDILEKLANEIVHRNHLPEASSALFTEGTNIVFSYDNRKVIKIFPPFNREHYINELLVLKYLQGKLSVETPVVEGEGEIYGWPYIIMSQLKGTSLESLWEKIAHHNKISLIRELGVLIREVHSLPTTGLEEIDSQWGHFINQQINHCVEHHRDLLPERLLRQIPSYLKSISESLKTIKQPVILTGEYTPMNLLVTQEAGIWHINGLIDFGDCMLGSSEYDLLGPGVFLIQGDKVLLKEFLLAYGYLPALMTETLSHKLTALMLLHQYSNLDIQIRIKNWQNYVSSLKELEDLVWGL